MCSGLLVLEQPRPHLQLAGAVSSEEQPTGGEFDGLHFFVGEEFAPLVEPERRDAVAVGLCDSFLSKEAVTCQYVTLYSTIDRMF